MNKLISKILNTNPNNYEDILKVINDYQLNESDIFYLINYFSCNGKLEFALKLFEQYRDKLEHFNYLNSIVSHLTILISLKDYEELKLVKEEYLSAPYISQEVEEFLKNIDKTIQSIMKAFETVDVINNEDIDINNVKKLLDDKNPDNVLYGLFLEEKIKKDGINLDEYVKNLCQKSTNFSLKNAYLINFLLENKIAASITIEKMGTIITFNTNEYFNSYSDAKKRLYKKINEINGIAKEVGIYNVFVGICTKTFLFVIPEYLESFDADTFLRANYEIILSMYQNDGFDDPIINYLSINDKLYQKYYDLVNLAMKIIFMSSTDDITNKKINA